MGTQVNNSDVIVVGGGVIGLSCAYHLAREGLRVTLLERGRCGGEASWAGAGMLECPSWHRDDTYLELIRRSLGMYPEFVEDLRERTRIDPEFVRCGSLTPLYTEQRMETARRQVELTMEHCGSAGRGLLQLLTADEAREREPALQLGDDVRGVLHAPVAGQVRNPRLLKALLSACVQQNVTIRESQHVRELRREGDRVTGVRCESHDYTADHVVLAAGAWTPLIENRLRPQTPVYPVRGQMLLLATKPRLFTHLISRGHCYLVPRLDGHVLLGATEEHESGYEKRTTVGGLEALMERGRALVPALGEATLVRSWAGLRPGSPDRRPFLGPVPGMPGLWTATGHFRSGLILAPVTGRVIADLMVRGSTEIDLERLTPGREIRAGKPPKSFPAAEPHCKVNQPGTE